MPYRHQGRAARYARRPIALLCAVLAATTVGAATTGGPAIAKPVDPKLNSRIHDVNAALHRLARQSDQLDEEYNVAATALAAAQRTAKDARQAAYRAQARYRAAHARFVSAAVQQLEGGPDPSVGDLLMSDSPQQFLDTAALKQYLDDRFAFTAQAQDEVHAAAVEATKRAVVAVVDARSKRAALASRRAALHQQSQRFTKLLASLTARQRREIARARAIAAARARAALLMQFGPGARGAAAALKSVPAAVRRVLAFAEAQVGKPYVFGAAGPGAYDCSGLTMAAWARAGVGLPHSAADQFNYGRHVAFSQLRPGDLIFLYSPISHVEIYVGNDLAVSAADPALGIVFVRPSQDVGNFAGATRLTG
jgi:cell wall-associated NlpC family hydrolase